MFSSKNYVFVGKYETYPEDILEEAAAFPWHKDSDTTLLKIYCI